MERPKTEKHGGAMGEKVCLITGATSGIGKATAMGLAIQRKGVPTPRGGKWHRFTLRTMILNETYAGTYYYGKTRKREIPTVRVVNGERIYGSRTEKEDRPEEEWIGVPVPDSGIPRETIERARQRIEGNTWTPSNNNGLVWELSAGVGLCGECGSRLRTRSPNNSTRTHFYYTCLNDSCPSNKHYRKEELEKRVGRELADTLRPDTWREFVERTISHKLRDLQKMHRYPSESREALLTQKSALEGKLDRALDLHIDGEISKEKYLEKKFAIEDQIEIVEQELSKLDNLDGEIKRIEFMCSLLLGIGPPQDGMPEVGEDGHVDTYSIFTDWGGEPTPALPDGGKERASERRQDFYRKMDLCVRVRPDDLEVEIANLAISQSANLS
jgi:site-specific DNA recombinase